MPSFTPEIPIEVVGGGPEWLSFAARLRATHIASLDVLFSDP